MTSSHSHNLFSWWFSRYILSINSFNLQQLYYVGTIIISTLHREKMKHIEVKKFVHGPTIGKIWSEVSNPAI